MGSPHSPNSQSPRELHASRPPRSRAGCGGHSAAGAPDAADSRRAGCAGLRRRRRRRRGSRRRGGRGRRAQGEGRGRGAQPMSGARREGGGVKRWGRVHPRGRGPSHKQAPEPRRGSGASGAERTPRTFCCATAPTRQPGGGTGPEVVPRRGGRREGGGAASPGRSRAQPPPPPEVWAEPELPGGNFFSFPPSREEEEAEEEGKPLLPPAPTLAGSGRRGPQRGRGPRPGGPEGKRDRGCGAAAQEDVLGGGG